MSKIEAATQENVVIRAGRCSLTVMPQMGGKIASLTLDGRELLQTPLMDYAPRSRTMSFDAADASGWDECLPSVAACILETQDNSIDIPDHGDLWRVAWDPISIGPDFAAYRGECFSLPLRLERRAALTESATGCRLALEYRVTNLELESPTPWSWAAHPLFAVEAGDRIVLPPSLETLRLEGSGGQRLGKGGDPVAWPMAQLSAGGDTDLSLVQAAESAIGDKLFAGPLTAHQNWCALERPSAGLRIQVSFDPAATPYLGLWICYGGWPERPGPKQMCVALEPSTAPVDSLAVTGPWSRILGPGQTFSWTMTVEIESIPSVNRHA